MALMNSLENGRLDHADVANIRQALMKQLQLNHHEKSALFADPEVSDQVSRSLLLAA